MDNARLDSSLSLRVNNTVVKMIWRTRLVREKVISQF
jgi:hypothetical protein